MTATSCRAMAKLVGVSKSYMTEALPRVQGPGDRNVGLDGKSYPAHRIPLVPSEDLIDLRSQGLSYRAIASMVGVSHQTIMRLFQNLDVLQVAAMLEANDPQNLDVVQVSSNRQVDQERKKAS